MKGDEPFQHDSGQSGIQTKRPLETVREDLGPSAEARAVGTLLLGCLLVGSSSTFVKLSGTSADTAAFLRCALSLVVFVPLMLLEWRRHGHIPRSTWLYGLGAGVLLGFDYAMWTQSILDSGAAVATVLIGVQVVVLPFLARTFLREKIRGRFLFALPVMIAGLALTGGVMAADPQANHPIRGAILGITAGVCYAGYVFLLRPASAAGSRFIVMPTGFGTMAATCTIAVIGFSRGGIDGDIDPGAWLWLIALAIGGQALPFILIGYGSVRVSASRAGAVMLLQPVAAIALGIVILGETPTLSQYCGMFLTVAAVATVSFEGRPQPSNRGVPS